MIKGKVKEMERLKAMGNVWGVDSRGRDDQLRRMLERALNAKREEALDKLSENQKMFALEALTDNLGLNSGEMYGFMEGLDRNLEEDCPYEDLAEAEEDLAVIQAAMDKQRAKMKGKEKDF